MLRLDDGLAVRHEGKFCPIDSIPRRLVDYHEIQGGRRQPRFQTQSQQACHCGCNYYGLQIVFEDIVVVGGDPAKILEPTEDGFGHRHGGGDIFRQ